MTRFEEKFAKSVHCTLYSPALKYRKKNAENALKMQKNVNLCQLTLTFQRIKFEDFS